MVCPHCQKELPEKYAASWCPFCGKNLPPDLLPAPGTPVTWWLFWCILLAPAVFAAIGSLTGLDDLAVASPLIGGGIAGIICGVMLLRSLAYSVETKVMLGFVMVPLFAFLSFALGFGGCMLAGGVPLNVH
jgi:hypothetical protein